MVASRKAESKTEDAKEKVRAWSSTASDVSDGSKELGDQIARLMATLNRAEQGTHPASAPNSPGHRVMGEGRQTGTLLPAPAPTMVGLAWTKTPLLIALLLPVG